MVEKFYKIGDFANMIGVSQVTLRRWEQAGILKPHHKSPSGYRYYTQTQLEVYLNGGQKEVSTCAESKSSDKN